jgi:hypothetical protein
MTGGSAAPLEEAANMYGYVLADSAWPVDQPPAGTLT